MATVNDFYRSYDKWRIYFQFHPACLIRGHRLDIARECPFGNTSVYFLLKGDEVLYVGKSQDLSYRIQAHLRFGFDSILFLNLFPKIKYKPDHRVLDYMTSDVEMIFIFELRPCGNRNGYKDRNYSYLVKNRDEGNVSYWITRLVQRISPVGDALDIMEPSKPWFRPRRSKTADTELESILKEETINK